MEYEKVNEMNTMVLITASECKKCEYVKKHVDCKHVDVLDRNSTDAIALMAVHGIYDKDLHLPVFISDKYDDEPEIIAGHGLQIIERIKFYNAIEQTMKDNEEALKMLSKC